MSTPPQAVHGTLAGPKPCATSAARRPAVTVVIPTRDRADLLSLTLRSVLRQRGVEIEVIVVDDGDGPETEPLVHALADPRVRFVRNGEPRGTCGARNRGVALARGEWVAFCDDDDLWAPEKLRAQIRTAMNEGTAWAYAGHVTAGPDLRVLSGSPPAAADEVLRDLGRHNAVPAGASNVIVRVEALARAGPFDPELRTSEDWDMWLRLARTAGRPACVPRPLVALRVHARMVSRRVDWILADIEVIARRHGIPVDRARHRRWAAWMALEEGRRAMAIRHYARAFAAGDWRSAARAVAALLDPGVARRRSASPRGTWIREAQTWLDALHPMRQQPVSSCLRGPRAGGSPRVTSTRRPVADGVTVIVPTTGGPMLAGCLDALASGGTWPARVVVVDQGGRGEVAGWVAALRARSMDVVHVPMARTGISAATNRGLERVETPYAAVTHDDCRVRPDWLERLAARLIEVGDAVLTGRVEAEGDGIVLTVKTASEPATYTAPLLREDVLFPPNMGFHVRLLQRVGWFDEHPSLATAGEDNDWGHRILRAGVPIVYDPAIVVGHLARYDARDLPALYLRYARGQGAFYGKWLRRGDLFIARRAARDVVRAPWLLVRGLATRNADLVAMGKGEIAGLLPGILAGLRNRP